MNRICSSLSDNGYQVTLIGRRKKKSIPLQKQSYGQVRLRCIFEKGFWFYSEYNIRLFFYLLFQKADVISSADIDTALPGLLAAKLRGKKFVFDAHEYFTEVIELQNRPFIKRIWLGIESFVVKRSAYNYTVSEGLKKIFEEKYGSTFEVIRNLPVLKNYPEEQKKENYIVYAGAVNEGRGLEELIEIWPEMDVKLYICGEGDILEKLKRKAAGLNNKIIFTGYKKPEEFRRIIRGAYAGVLLLKKESLSYYYSLANKFFDYIHAGVPQITIDFPEYRLLNDQYNVAILCDLDKEQIKRGLKKLSEDQNFYNVLKENTRKAAGELNWQKESMRLLEFYKKVSEHEQ
jgi:glycosyltransferase involved in cell wall biosynthesis